MTCPESYQWSSKGDVGRGFGSLGLVGRPGRRRGRNLGLDLRRQPGNRGRLPSVYFDVVYPPDHFLLFNLLLLLLLLSLYSFLLLLY